MATKTEICNLALSNLKIDKEIANIETENSAEANACRRYFDMAIKATLRDFTWPFATKIADLSLVEEDPNDEWGYSYRYPTDCVFFRRILSGTRNDSRDTRVPYRIARDATARIILTDMKSASAEYTEYVSDPTQWPEDFAIAFSFRLSAYIVQRITGGDPFKLKDEAMKSYQIELSLARANSADEEQPEEEPESEFIRARY